MIDVKFTAQVQVPGNHSSHIDPAQGQNVSSPLLSSDQRGGALALCIMYTGKGLAVSTLLPNLETVPKIYCEMANFDVSVSKYYNEIPLPSKILSYNCYVEIILN